MLYLILEVKCHFTFYPWMAGIEDSMGACLPLHPGCQQAGQLQRDCQVPQGRNHRYQNPSPVLGRPARR